MLNPKDPEKDITQDKNKAIIEWKSRNLQKSNLIAVHPSSEVEEILPGNYAMVFHKNLYHSQINNFINTIRPGYGYVCITFKVNGDEEQVLITKDHHAHDRFKEFHEISVTQTEINISGYLQYKLVKIPIQHNCRNWTTLFLDYTTHESVLTSEFTYILDNDPKMQGSFTLQRPRIVTPGAYIGARKDGTKAFAGSLHGIELHSTQSPQPIPQTLKELIIKTQQIKRFSS